MFRRVSAALVLAFTIFVAPATRAEPSVTVMPFDFEVEHFRGPQSYFARTLPTSPLLAEKLPLERPLVAVWGKAGGAALHLEKSELKQTRFTHAGEEAPLPEAPRNAVPGTRMQSAGPLTVFVSAPRSDYRHGVFGRIDNAGAITITEKQPLAGVTMQARAVPVQTATIQSGPDAVFEDIEPRLADLDGDGTPEIVIVKSYLDKGSALAVIGKRDGAWKLVAETPPIGERHRWLAPAVIADFDADGTPDIALVRTPHLRGVLQVWGWKDGKLALKHEAVGYSSHVLGSTAVDNAAAIDLDGDGRPELVLPTVDRKALAVLSFTDSIKELRRIPLPSPAGRGLAALGSGNDTHILAALEDGRLAVVRP
jgi:FG-GAP-like repeat